MPPPTLIVVGVSNLLNFYMGAQLPKGGQLDLIFVKNNGGIKYFWVR
jgi:hypothetical protein